MPKKPFWETNPKRANAKPAEVEAFAAAISAPVDHSLPAPAPASRRSKSYSELLQRLYEQFDVLADDIAASDAPPHQRADALSKLARSLPLIQAAEQAAKTKVRNKDVTALSDAELEAEVARQLGKKANSPTPAASRPVVTPPSQNKKNDSEGLPTFDHTDEE